MIADWIQRNQIELFELLIYELDFGFHYTFTNLVQTYVFDMI